MGSRPGDWHPLTEYGEDPVPGDWELVKEAAARYRRTADSIQRAQTLLNEVTSTSDGWEGQSGDAFREKADELSDNVFKAYGRYDATASALAEYWPQFEEAQEESLRLRRQALEVHAEIQQYEQRAEASADDDSETHDQHETNIQNLEAAQTELNRLRTRLAQVVEERDAAAQRAADAIGDFIGDDGLKDGWRDKWDSFCNALSQAVALIGQIAGQIAMVAGLLALALAWVPGLGQALAAVALIATAISLTANLYTGNWAGAFWDTLGLATFGLGRVAGAMTRAARARGVMRVNSRARQSASSLRGEGRVEELRRLEGLTRVTRQDALTAWEELRNIRQVANGRLGWAGHAFHNVGPDLARSLRAPFSASGWGIHGGGLRQMLGATPVDEAGAALARSADELGGEAAGVLSGNAAALNRVAGMELAPLAGMSGLGAFTLDSNWGVQWNLPVGPGGVNVPFSNLPGVSLSTESPWPQEATPVGDFSHGESEAMAR